MCNDEKITGTKISFILMFILDLAKENKSISYFSLLSLIYPGFHFESWKYTIFVNNILVQKNLRTLSRKILEDLLTWFSKHKMACDKRLILIHIVIIQVFFTV